MVGLSGCPDTYVEVAMHGMESIKSAGGRKFDCKSKCPSASYKTKATSLMSCPDACFSVLVKEERTTIALSAYTFLEQLSG